MLLSVSMAALACIRGRPLAGRAFLIGTQGRASWKRMGTSTCITVGHEYTHRLEQLQPNGDHRWQGVHGGPGKEIRARHHTAVAWIALSLLGQRYELPRTPSFGAMS